MRYRSLLFSFLMMLSPLLHSQGTPVVINDSLFFDRVRGSRSSEGPVDFSEPLNQRFFTGRDSTRGISGLIRISRESSLLIGFDNDILNYTDRFYTNGIRLALTGPFLAGNVLNHLLIPGFGQGRNYYGIEVVQNMYTPSTTKTGGIPYGDRPYSSYLYGGIFKIFTDPAHTFRQSNAIRLGVIGPLSFGAWVQDAFHTSVPTNDKPLGWEYQIANDLVLNWEVQLEKGIVNHHLFELHLRATGSLGTLYTNMGGGFRIRAGKMNPYYLNLGVVRKKIAREEGLKLFQFYFFATAYGKLIAYDATLQGGIFNHSSVYTIPSGEISRFTAQSTLGFALVWQGIQLDLEQYFLSPEFRSGLWHRWVHIGLTIAL